MSGYMGGDSSLYLTNPQLAVALRQQALATPFMQQGTDPSPVRSPWQGAAKIGNALVAALLLNKSQDAIQQGIASQNSASDDAMATYRALSQPQAAPQGAPMPQPAPQAAAPQSGAPGNVALGAALTNNPAPGSAIPSNVKLASVLIPGGGKISVNADAVGPFQGLVNDLTAAGYKIDGATTGGYNPRDIAGTNIPSQHAFGHAVDINWADNPRGKSGDIPPDLAHAVAAKNGLIWGGDWKNPDPMHFELRPIQTAQAGNVATDAAPPVGMPQAPQGAPGGAMPPQMPQAPGAAPAGAMPPTGANSPNVQRALQMMQAATEMETKAPFDPRVRAIAAGLRQQAQMIGGLDTFAQGPGGVQINTRTGQQMNGPVPTPNYQETQPGVYTSPGQKPVFQPAQRIVNVPGVGAVQTNQGGGATVVAPINPSGVAAVASAENQGKQSGKTLPTVDSMGKMGTEAATAIGNIDYGLNQLHQAAAGGLPSGKMTPIVADAAAWAKSLGVDTTKFGVDPNAVANVQAGAKTLAVLGGRIIQQAIGPDSQITEGKVEAFIHAHPDLANDPGAIEKILGWARSQYVFSNNMAKDAMAHADPQTGMIPAGWRADYARRFGFAPIYDPLSGEMKQPQNGQGPSEEAPAPQAAAPAQQAAAPQYREGQTATGPGGKKLVFKGGAWQPM